MTLDFLNQIPRKPTYSWQCSDCGKHVTKEMPQPMPATVDRTCDGCGAIWQIDPEILKLKFEVAVLKQDLANEGAVGRLLAYGILNIAREKSLLTAADFQRIVDGLEESALEQINDDPNFSTTLNSYAKLLRNFLQ